MPSALMPKGNMLANFRSTSCVPWQSRAHRFPNRRSTMLDHMGLGVSDYEKSKVFYVKALKPLGIGIIMEVTAEQTGNEAATGFGKNQKPFFWIGAGEEGKGHIHVA